MMFRTLRKYGPFRHTWLLAALAVSALAGPAAQGEPVHGLALHGTLKYGDGFTHLDYANPDAPTGGSVKLAVIGTFDSLNGFILKGEPAVGLSGLYDTLTYHTGDEAFSEYGLLAESIEVADDGSWVAFTLRPEARFHDGKPVTVEDVIWTFETLKSKGHPALQAYYGSVSGAKKTGERTVRFSFSGGENRELPLILGQMAVLPRHYWEGRSFDKTTLDPPLGSGAYRIESVDPGRSITYARVNDYWGRNLPINKGRNNFGRLRYEYYRDTTVALEAFKSGAYDFRLENVSKLWATGYDGPALKAGLIRKEEIAHQRPTGMQGFAFNTRRPLFKDPRVRQALAYAFDFEWTNKNLFYGAYTRTGSYFSNSELAARGLPSPAELTILKPYRDRLPSEVFEAAYRPPTTDGTGNIRRGLRRATRLLKDAGWVIRDNQLVNAATGQPFAFEMMLVQPVFERVVLPFRRNLKRLGIDMRVRSVDASQYQKRLDEFDFDMVVVGIGQSLSPGNEQRSYWTSKAAATPGSNNLIGVSDAVVDDLVELVIAAPDRESLVNRVRALDRVLLWGHYVIPNWHLQVFRVAYWDKFARPAVSPKYELGFDTWWVDSKKAAALAKQRPNN